MMMLVGFEAAPALGLTITVTARCYVYNAETEKKLLLVIESGI